MIKYSPRAAVALGFLKKFYNDIEVYVEDTGNHNMWLKVLRASMPTGTQLTSVNLLGGREAVLKACKLDQVDDGRKKLYIVDGDFDFLLGKPKPKLKHLYRIRAYCVENLLISAGSLLEIALEVRPTMTEQQVLAAFDLARFVNDVASRLGPLFQCYAACYQLDCSIQTVGFSVMKLCSKVGGRSALDRRKIAKRMRDVYRNLLPHFGINDVMQARREVARRARVLGVPETVSGKSYILPLLFVEFKRVFGYGQSLEAFKVALARSYSPRVEPFLHRRVRSVALRP